MTTPTDPYKTQRLSDLAREAARPITLPAYALIIPTLALLAALGLALSSIEAPRQTSRSLPRPIIATPTLGLPGPATAQGLAQAMVAYAAPDGQVLGALEPGRPYRLVARSGVDWAQLDVARPGETSNLVWVHAAALPELRGIQVADLATHIPTPAPQIIMVAAPTIAPVAPVPAEAIAPTAAPYLIPPATPAPRPIVMREFPTAQPCRLNEVGSVLRICNGITP
ncbi:MAG: hypothetical protein AB4911_16410 [Oscillochloridaceae bacterium umkhey_bin13]